MCGELVTQVHSRSQQPKDDISMLGLSDRQPMDAIFLKLADPCSILQFQSKTLNQFPDPQEAKVKTRFVPQKIYSLLCCVLE